MLQHSRVQKFFIKLFLYISLNTGRLDVINDGVKGVVFSKRTKKSGFLTEADVPPAEYLCCKKQLLYSNFTTTSCDHTSTSSFFQKWRNEALYCIVCIQLYIFAPSVF